MLTCCILLRTSKVGEIIFFVWNKDSVVALAVFTEIKPDIDKPFFSDNTSCHTTNKATNVKMVIILELD